MRSRSETWLLLPLLPVFLVSMFPMLLIGLLALSSFLLYRGRLFESRGVLWALMLAFPLPFVANTAGWMTAELGRQPWLVRDVLRTSAGSSLNVGPGSTLFSLLGFMGLYAMLSLLFFSIITRLLQRGLVAAEEA